MKYKNLALVVDRNVVVGAADGDVSVAIAVDITRGCHMGAAHGVALVAVIGPAGRGGEARRGAIEDQCSSLIGAIGLVGRCADDDVGVTVAVDIACGRDRGAEIAVDLVAVVGPGWSGWYS